MGRQQITEHIEAELSGRSTEATEPQETTDVLCQYCGIGIETEGQRPDDYVIHSIPSHGESGRNLVLYCSPACFQEAMGELLDV